MNLIGRSGLINIISCDHGRSGSRRQLATLGHSSLLRFQITYMLQIIKELPQAFAGILGTTQDNATMQEEWKRMQADGKVDLTEQEVLLHVVPQMRCELRVLDAEQDEVVLEEVEEATHRTAYEQLIKAAKTLNEAQGVQVAVTSKALYFVAEGEPCGFAVPYPDLPIMAVLPDETPAVFCHVDTAHFAVAPGLEEYSLVEDGDSEDAFPVMELKLMGESFNQIHELYEAVGECSSLYPFEGEDQFEDGFGCYDCDCSDEECGGCENEGGCCAGGACCAEDNDCDGENEKGEEGCGCCCSHHGWDLLDDDEEEANDVEVVEEADNVEK